MPFVDSTVSKTVATEKIYGPSGYSQLWSKCTVKASTDGDKVSYTITMTCGDTSGSGKQPMISLWVGIDSQTVVEADYYGSNWSSFPLKNGSTKSGSITTTAKNDTKIPISIKMLVSQNYKLHDSKWDDSLITEYITRTWYTNGSVSNPIIKDNGNNTFTLSSSYSEGTNNNFSSGKIYYTTNGSTPTTSSSSVTLSSSGTTINVPTSSGSYTVKAFAYGTFDHNADSSSVVSKTVYYYTNGSVPPTPTITDNGNNTFTISGKNSKAGTNNPIKTSMLYYKIGTADWKTKTLSTTSEGSYSVTLDIPSGSTTPTIRAQSECTFAWGSNADYKTRTSGEAVEKVKYYTAIGKPSVSIIDNNDNTFTISGTNASSGTNNTASTSYAWGYSTSYGNSGTGTKSLNIATPGNATRTVYAKATASPSWSKDTDKTATTSLAIKQYVAPSDPGVPSIKYTKSRLTLKENWTINWAPATATNSSSPVVGYRIRVYRKSKGASEFSTIPIKSMTTGELLTTSSNYYDREIDNTTMKINPVQNDIAVGDTIKIGIYSYTKDGNGVKKFSDTNVFSKSYVVQNAGIVNAKVSGAYKEGQVFVKVNGAWKEAESISAKVNGTWKESQ